jgi:hypothetical protein
LKAKRFSVREVDKLRTYTGIVDLSCITEKAHEDLKNKLLNELTNEGITYKEDNLILNCQREKIRFEVEIMKFSSFRYVRMKYLTGDKKSYNKTASKLLGSIML